MNPKVRTTIILPREDLQLVKMRAAVWGTTMSEIISYGIRRTPAVAPKPDRRSRGGWRSVAGSLNLGGKEPPTRAQLYERYFREKRSH